MMVFLFVCLVQMKLKSCLVVSFYERYSCVDFEALIEGLDF